MLQGRAAREAQQPVEPASSFQYANSHRAITYAHDFSADQWLLFLDWVLESNAFSTRGDRGLFGFLGRGLMKPCRCDNHRSTFFLSDVSSRWQLQDGQCGGRAALWHQPVAGCTQHAENTSERSTGQVTRAQPPARPVVTLLGGLGRVRASHAESLKPDSPLAWTTAMVK